MKNSRVNISWFQSKVYLAFFLLFTIVTIGILGFRILSNYSWVDAIYMTVITVTTVGFGEVNPLDDTSKLFTVFLIVMSVTIYLFAASIFTEYIANGDIIKKLKLRKVNKIISKLNGHTIIAGFGRNGKQTALKLKKSGRQFLIIENNVKSLEELKESGYLYIKGDATEDKVLEYAGIQKADSIIIALPSDADNLFITFSAKQKSKDILIISRATNETSHRKLIMAGADNVIMPDKIGGDHMASLVVSPDLIEFVDKISLDGDCETNLKELKIEEGLKVFENKSIMDLDIRKKTGCSVIGLKLPSGEYIVNPAPTSKLQFGSKIIVLGIPSQIDKLTKYF